MATKGKSGPPAKVSLRSGEPVKAKQRQTRKIQLDGSDESWRATHSSEPKPWGSEDNMRDAIKLLEIRGKRAAARGAAARRAIEEISAVYLLNRRRKGETLISEAVMLLHDISTAAELLHARLIQLPHPLDTKLQRSISLLSPLKDESAFMTDTLAHLLAISSAAQHVTAQLPQHRGGVVTVEAKMTGLDPVQRFLRDTVALYADHHTAAAVSGSKRSLSRGCYAFVCAAFEYATGEVFGRGKVFQAFVKNWRQTPRKKRNRLATLPTT